MKVMVLGCGSSGGVPLLGCDCPVCRSENPKNKRSRVSVLIEVGNKTFLIDTSPDLRQQCLRHGILSVDAIFYTHAHADHIHGIDDVRSLNYHRNAPIDIYSNPATLQELQHRFAYAFSPRNSHYGWYKPALVPHEICAGNLPEVIEIEGIPLCVFPQQHGEMVTLGFRFGDFAYSTDTNGLPECSLKTLEGVHTWLVDCLRPSRSPTHAHLALTLEWIDQVKPKRAILTHMGHEFGYEELCEQLPAGVEPAYDGMEIEIA